MTNHDNTMKAEISKRLNDTTWDLQIARGVFKKKKQKTARYVYSFSFSSVAAAAVLFIVISTGFNSQNSNYRYDDFISQQIHGTYSTVFTASSEDINNSPEDDLIAVQSIDTMIDDTLAMR